MSVLKICNDKTVILQWMYGNVFGYTCLCTEILANDLKGKI